MPDNDAPVGLVDKAVAAVKSWFPKSTTTPTPAQAPKKSDYSVAREARDTGSSVNYNQKQAQAARDALKDVGVK
jgi:hypothetical protein